MTERASESADIRAFDYALPDDLIAQTPLRERSASRMLVLDRKSGAITHGGVRDLPTFVNPGDVVVANNSRVLPARLRIQRLPSGGAGELLLLRQLDTTAWEALGRPAKRLRKGNQFALTDRHGTDASAGGTVEERLADGVVRIRFSDPEMDISRFGEMPLPPYIRTRLDDADRYQTEYATVLGSAAAPTAGLHLTAAMREEIVARGAEWAEVTLHVGLDTFRPVKVETIDEHRMHSEWCRVPATTIGAIQRSKEAGGRVIAIGTTTVRALEAMAEATSQESGIDAERDWQGWVDIFITPGFQFRVIDGLLTNFHLPRSTLLMMVSALAGRFQILRAYEDAIRERYRFFSFGDAMLII